MTLYYINYLPVNPSKSVIFEINRNKQTDSQKKCYSTVHTSMYMHLVEGYLYATVTLTSFIDFQ